MKLVDSQIVLNLLNLSSKHPTFPSYNHVVIEGKLYPLKGDISLFNGILVIDEKNDKEYHSFVVKVTGEIKKSKGNMPNPMVNVDCFEIESLKLV